MAAWALPQNWAPCSAQSESKSGLGLSVIAEGVETEDQRSLLALHGCLPARRDERLKPQGLAVGALPDTFTSISTRLSPPLALLINKVRGTTAPTCSAVFRSINITW